MSGFCEHSNVKADCKKYRALWRFFCCSVHYINFPVHDHFHCMFARCETSWCHFENVKKGKICFFNDFNEVGIYSIMKPVA
jgi:hypothetical protein